MKPLLLLWTVFVLASFGHSQPVADVDAIRYFDEKQRWHNEFTEHWFYFFDIPENEIRKAIQQWQEIGEDLKTSINPAEGTYGDGGETHGDYLRWSEKKGFVWLNVNKCMGGPMKITRGRIERTQTLFRFVPEIVVGGSHQHGHHSSRHDEVEFLPVKWRNVDFLIQKRSLGNFADYTAGLNPATSGLYDESWYLSKVMQKYVGSVNELPIFPLGFEKYAKSPFKAKIISIGKSYRQSKPRETDETGLEIEQFYDDFVTEVKIDVGKSSGITPGVLLRFLIENDDYRIHGIVINKVFDMYSLGQYVRDIPKRDCRKTEYETCKAEEGKKLKVGQRLSTTGEW